MKILMIANFVSFPWEKGNSRFLYLLDRIDYKKHEAELITTSFYHHTKQKRQIKQSNTKNLKYKITLLDEPGYPKNVCLKRFYSHHILSKNLKKYLQNQQEKPDVIYCTVPSLDFAYEAAKYARKHKIKFIIDIQDIWPEAFKMVFNPPLIGRLLYVPFEKKANFIYSSADEIIAVSETYAKRALSVNKKTKKLNSVFLGTELSQFDIFRKNSKPKNQDEIKLAYIGTLGHSYDIKSVIDALALLKNQSIKFVVMGDGPLRKEFEKHAKNKAVNCKFTGKLNYEKMVSELCSCDIVVNPITHGAAQSIINKVGDYAAAGLPVVNTQECPEYRDLIKKYNAGLNCENGNTAQLAKAIETLAKDQKLRQQLGKNNRRLAEEKFDRAKTYPEILSIIYGKVEK